MARAVAKAGMRGEHEGEILGAELAQRAIEDVGRAEQARRRGVGGERVAARRDDEIRARQGSRVDPVAEGEEADRREAALDQGREHAPRRPAVAADLEAPDLDGAQPCGGGDDAVRQVIVAGAAVGDEKDREGWHATGR